MADYTNDIATATEMLAEFGMAMFYNVQEEVWNPVTEEPEITITKKAFVGVKTNPTTDEIEAGYPTNSIIVLASSASLENIKLKETISIGNKDYNIMSFNEVAPAEQTILYKIVLLEKGK